MVRHVAGTKNLFATQMRIKFFALLFCSAFCFAALQGVSASETTRVVTSFYPVYVATLNVTAGVPGVEVHNLTSPHIGCLHDYQLTAGDVRQLADADLLLANGAGMETFLGKVKEQAPSLRVVEVSDGIPLMDGNAHVWVSFEGARQQVDNITAALIQAAPGQADAFRANAENYKSALTALDEKMRAALASSPASAIDPKDDAAARPPASAWPWSCRAPASAAPARPAAA
jgi:zinc transport system substrate-binding protein